jgi:hypothetical protein
LPWSTSSEDPIPLPNGRWLLTLRCASYIMKLPKAEHSAPEWQAAMEALILVAENDGPTMLARIGVMPGNGGNVCPIVNRTRKIVEPASPVRSFP